MRGSYLLLHGIRKEVRELHEQVRVICEQLRDLFQNFFDSFLLFLIGMQDLQEGPAVHTDTWIDNRGD